MPQSVTILKEISENICLQILKQRVLNFYLFRQVEILNTEAVDLKQRYPIHEEPISEKETALSECWNELQEKV